MTWKGIHVAMLKYRLDGAKASPGAFLTPVSTWILRRGNGSHVTFPSAEWIADGEAETEMMSVCRNATSFRSPIPEERPSLA